MTSRGEFHLLQCVHPSVSPEKEEKMLESTDRLASFLTVCSFISVVATFVLSSMETKIFLYYLLDRNLAENLNLFPRPWRSHFFLLYYVGSVEAHIENQQQRVVCVCVLEVLKRSAPHHTCLKGVLPLNKSLLFVRCGRAH